MELHVVRPIFILLLWGFTLGLKADDLSVIRQKYIESILYKNKSEQQLIRLMCQMSHEKVVGDQMVVELMERCPIEVGYVRQLLSDLSEQGSWNGLDFTNSKAASWLKFMLIRNIPFINQLRLQRPFIRLWGIGSG